MRILCMILLLIIVSCERLPFITDALVPEYFDALDFSEIRSTESQPIISQGTIVQRENYLFINDRKRGIHVVDNSQPGSPTYMFFWNIPGNQTFTIQDDYLYADNGPHMLVINISDFANIQYERYIENVFYENMREQFPEDAFAGQYFVCPDPAKGLAKSWSIETVENPQCQKI